MYRLGTAWACPRRATSCGREYHGLGTHLYNGTIPQSRQTQLGLPLHLACRAPIPSRSVPVPRIASANFLPCCTMVRPDSRLAASLIGDRAEGKRNEQVSAPPPPRLRH